MSSRRVFSNNNDSTYNNYKSIRKLSSLNIGQTQKYNVNKVCEISYNTVNKPPITIIDGINSFFINDKIYDYNNNCKECINSVDFCDLNNCKKISLYPYGEFSYKSYNRCKENCIEIIQNNKKVEFIYDLNKYYNNDDEIKPNLI